LAVADAVERREHLFGELRRLLENAALEIRRQLLELGKTLVVPGIAEQLVAREQDVAQGRFVFGHGEESRIAVVDRGTQGRGDGSGGSPRLRALRRDLRLRRPRTGRRRPCRCRRTWSRPRTSPCGACPR